MPSWWGKSSSKDKKSTKENLIDTFHRLISTNEQKGSTKSKRNFRRGNDASVEKVCQSTTVSRPTSPSKEVSRCQSFSADRPHAQPLPIPGVRPRVARTVSNVIEAKPILEKRGKPPLLLPLPKPSLSHKMPGNSEFASEPVVASVSSNCSADSEDNGDSQLQSPIGNDAENTIKVTSKGKSSNVGKERAGTIATTTRKDISKPANSFLSNHIQATSPRGVTADSYQQNLRPVVLESAPNSLMSSPSRSPRRICPDHIPSSAFWAVKPHADVTFLGSGQCSSPGSGQTSGHNSVGGDMLGQLFWQPSRGSPECSPIPSPRMASPGPSSRVHSGSVSPLHPKSGGMGPESPTFRRDDGKKKQTHKLPLPPLNISNSSFFPNSSTPTSPISVPRSPGRAENLPSPASRWKKGKLIGRGTFGHVYVGFNNDSGEMCAMKEVPLFLDDPKSTESARGQKQEESVGLALHSVLGGAAEGFHVTEQAPRHFRFAVASKNVGLHIVSKHRIVAANFDVYFHLWRDGGPDWFRELQIWQKEEERQWTLVTSKKKKRKARKSVLFAEQLELPSPVIKSKPAINQVKPLNPAIAPSFPAVRVGSMLCPIISTAITSHKRVINGKDLDSRGLKRTEEGTVQNFKFESNEARSKADGSLPEQPSYTHLRETCSTGATVSTVNVDQDGLNSTMTRARRKQANNNDHAVNSATILTCFRCLSPYHFVRFCNNRLRCRFCYREGHVERFCFRKKVLSKKEWRPNSQPAQDGDLPKNREEELTQDMVQHHTMAAQSSLNMMVPAHKGTQTLRGHNENQSNKPREYHEPARVQAASQHPSNHIWSGPQRCFRCFSPNHFIRHCRERVRCRFCYRSGHIERKCSRKWAISQRVWRPKSIPSQQPINPIHDSRENQQQEISVENLEDDLTLDGNPHSPFPQPPQNQEDESVAALVEQNLHNPPLGDPIWDAAVQKQHIHGWEQNQPNQLMVITDQVVINQNDKPERSGSISPLNSSTGLLMQEQISSSQVTVHKPQPTMPDWKQFLTSKNLQQFLNRAMPWTFQTWWKNLPFEPVKINLQVEGRNKQSINLTIEEHNTALLTSILDNLVSSNVSLGEIQNTNWPLQLASTRSILVDTFSAAVASENQVSAVMDNSLVSPITDNIASKQIVAAATPQQVYVRRKFKLQNDLKLKLKRKKRTRITKKRVMMQDPAALLQDKAKGKAVDQTPLVTTTLRRSRRIELRDQGFKMASSSKQAIAITKAHQITNQQHVNTSNNFTSTEFPGPIKFPDLADLQNLSEPYPEIPLQILQKVAQEVCGIPPKEVSLELLMKQDPTCL